MPTRVSRRRERHCATRAPTSAQRPSRTSRSHAPRASGPPTSARGISPTAGSIVGSRPHRAASGAAVSRGAAQGRDHERAGAVGTEHVDQGREPARRPWRRARNRRWRSSPLQAGRDGRAAAGGSPRHGIAATSRGRFDLWTKRTYRPSHARAAPLHPTPRFPVWPNRPANRRNRQNLGFAAANRRAIRPYWCGGDGRGRGGRGPRGVAPAGLGSGVRVAARRRRALVRCHPTGRRHRRRPAPRSRSAPPGGLLASTVLWSAPAPGRLVGPWVRHPERSSRSRRPASAAWWTRTSAPASRSDARPRRRSSAAGSDPRCVGSHEHVRPDAVDDCRAGVRARAPRDPDHRLGLGPTPPGPGPQRPRRARLGARAAVPPPPPPTRFRPRPRCRARPRRLLPEPCLDAGHRTPRGTAGRTGPGSGVCTPAPGPSPLAAPLPRPTSSLPGENLWVIAAGAARQRPPPGRAPSTLEPEEIAPYWHTALRRGTARPCAPANPRASSTRVRWSSSTRRPSGPPAAPGHGSRAGPARARR